MKRSLLRVLALAIVALLLSCPALAAGKLVAVQQNFHVLDNNGVYAYAFAKVENTGDAPVMFSAGLLEVYDRNGDPLTSTDNLFCYPGTLQPGEYGYIYAYESIDMAETMLQVGYFNLTVSGKKGEAPVVRYPVTSEYQENVQYSDSDPDNFIVAEITNDTDKTAYGIEFAVAILDDQDNILFVAHDDLSSIIGINAGSAFTYRNTIYSGFYDLWEMEGTKPTHVDVIAYTQEQVY